MISEYSSATSSPRDIFTVSKLNRLARSILEGEIGQIWLSAEISNFVAASSGHWYFTLKDSRAQVKAAMFKGANRRVTTQPKHGDHVLVRANVGLYEPRGDYQLVVEYIEPEGEGRLKQAFEQSKLKLASQGLFAQEHKQSLPETIRSVGIITSATGAALHDISSVMARRNPTTGIIVYPSMVQGETASASLIKQIEQANQRQEVDVLLLTRGGGSLEDLWCFNDENLALAIYNSALPIISAVGHEVDVTISDFVADVRAATPSAAAELVTQDQQVLLNQASQTLHRLQRSMGNQLAYKQNKLAALEPRLTNTHPKRKIAQQQDHLAQLKDNLVMNLQRHIAMQKQKHAHLGDKLTSLSPQTQVNKNLQDINQLKARLTLANQGLLTKKSNHLASMAQLLDTVSPLATLARGYNISFKGEQLIKSVEHIEPEDELIHKMVDGEIVSRVLRVSKQSS